MKKIIVTGCNGQLGRAINQVYADSREYECVNTDVAQLDITNIEAVMKLAEEVKPYAIINCAAHTNVNACETDVDNAYKINAIGPRELCKGICKGSFYHPYSLVIWRWQEFCKDNAQFVTESRYRQSSRGSDRFSNKCNRACKSYCLSASYR